MSEKFSQFSVGDLEAGARKRQSLAERRRQAQVREGRKSSSRRLRILFHNLVVHVGFLCIYIRSAQIKYGFPLLRCLHPSSSAAVADVVKTDGTLFRAWST